MALLIAAWMTLGFGLILTSFRRVREPSPIPRAVVVDNSSIEPPRRFRIAKLQLVIGVLVLLAFPACLFFALMTGQQPVHG
ncbi:MAG TPA: hypothetical protein VGO00_01820 [Kofleriaceae bacterium]|jgi:hypothetical protein|nr:hypothetical protein [Kofleriaceae bacterium]